MSSLQIDRRRFALFMVVALMASNFFIITIATIAWGQPNTANGNGNGNGNGEDEQAEQPQGRLRLLWTAHTPSEPGVAFYGVGKSTFRTEDGRLNAQLSSIERARANCVYHVHSVLTQLAEQHLAQLATPSCRDAVIHAVSEVSADLASVVNVSRQETFDLEQVFGVCTLACLPFEVVAQRMIAAIQAADPAFRFSAVELELLLKETQYAVHGHKKAPK